MLFWRYQIPVAMRESEHAGKPMEKTMNKSHGISLWQSNIGMEHQHV